MNTDVEYERQLRQATFRNVYDLKCCKIFEYIV